MDNEDDFKTWKPEEYFDTIPELVNRKYNRLSKQQLEDERSKTPHEEVKGETLRAVICVCRHGDR